MRAFLAGAGVQIPAGGRPPTPTPDWMHHLGALLRASVDGMLALLHSRSTVKREMRAEMTGVASRQNNPLKFAPDAASALLHLVGSKRSPSFLEPVAAVKDAHDDLLAHHLAVVAGMRAAMFELIGRLGPDVVVHDEGPPRGLAAWWRTRHEAALWRRYRQHHAELTTRLDDDFEALFGREFTKAYEAQARALREGLPAEDSSAH
jgi:type VI secretion system FHA domain protein